MSDTHGGLLRRAEGAAIPRILHQTYHAADLPEPLRKNVEQLKQANPGWEYRFYDDAAIERFIAGTYGQRILGYYRRINPEYGAARADLFRYLLIYAVGGVYLDIKSRATQPLDVLLGFGTVFVSGR